MGNRPRDNRIAVKVAAPFVGPYADPAPLYTGPPQVQTYQTTANMVPVFPAFQDVRNVPIMVGYNFRKRVFAGI